MASEGQDRADALGWGRRPNRPPNRPKTFARNPTIPQKVTNVSIYDKGSGYYMILSRMLQMDFGEWRLDELRRIYLPRTRVNKGKKRRARVYSTLALRPNDVSARGLSMTQVSRPSGASLLAGRTRATPRPSCHAHRSALSGYRSSRSGCPCQQHRKTLLGGYH